MKITDIDNLQWYAVRMVSPTNGHRRTTKIGGDKREVRRRGGSTVQKRKPGTGERVFVPELILKRAGFAVFLPVKKVWRRKHRFTSEQELVSFPLVADWMFVAWPLAESRWHELTALRVVSGVLGSGGRPIAFKGKTIAGLMKRWGDGVPPAVRRMAAGTRLVKGDQIRILEGPFEDFQGPVVEVTEAGARVCVNIFGRQTPVEVERAQMSVVQAVGRTAKPAPGVSSEGRAVCLRCNGDMVLAHDREKKHHLRCASCGAVGALNSDSAISALDTWARHGEIDLAC